MTNRVAAVVFGEADPRIRATCRFVMAWPLLPLVGALVGLAMPLLGLSGMIAGGPVQGVIFLAMLFLWAVPMLLYPATYLALLLWLRWYTGGITIQTSLAEWTDRLGPDSSTGRGPVTGVD